ncbi:MAG: phosphatidate cytidylyltransferase [Treponema sp.]|nr:phosphatidate cytidylyltransferase [Treponema sp.]MCL2273132.1 phosphatidate cytidylyltransferase [Treponema sp.]
MKVDIFTDIKNIIDVDDLCKSNETISREIIRKAIHFLIAFTPLLAAINKSFTVVFLIIGILSYILMESMRFSGMKVPVVSLVTSIVSRLRDKNRFVMGPVTLGLGSLLAVLLFTPSAAAIAIYALAFGDGFASLVGRIARLRPFFLYGKSIEGSLACFTAVFISAYVVSGSMHVSIAAALTAMMTEALPLEDYDNLVLPVTVGMIVQLIEAVPKQ